MESVIKQRSNSLDALRGMAILLMVLSGSIAFGGVLPGWMYHAQEPPPLHVFNSELPGITWVDLVFPFFLFSMGAAIPLAMKKRLAGRPPSGLVFWHITQRYLMLVFFALFIVHARAGVISGAPGIKANLLSIGCFLLLFMIYGQWKKLRNPYVSYGLKAIGLALGLLFLFFYPFGGQRFSFSNNDIIILILANVAFFGNLVWLVTRNYPLVRVGILPFIMAVILAGSVHSSFNSFIYNWSPLPWMYRFDFLKYLFIIIPATFAGEWLSIHAEVGRTEWDRKKRRTVVPAALVVLAIIVTNVVCLYNRFLLPNLFLTLGLCGVFYFLITKMPDSSRTFKKLACTGIYLLLLGLFFESYEGGIKKDNSTFSYYFVSSGLAFLLLTAFVLLEKAHYLKGMFNYLGSNGKNPMIAYTLGSLLLLPLMRITGTELLLDKMAQTAVGGFLRGLIFTGIVSLITIFCTRMKLFWKT